MGAKLFEALVGLRHNAPVIKRWVGGEEFAPTLARVRFIAQHVFRL